MTYRTLSILGIAVLAGCSSTPAARDGAAGTQVAMAARSSSQASGTLNVRPMGDGVHVSGRLSGLPANRELGFHIHEKGDCSAADASSAGGHFNPTAQAHGSVQAGAHHLGDQMNLRSDASGMATVDAHFSGVSLGTGRADDVAGKALVVHADPDDYTSQPAGNSGKRIACGVIAR